MPYQKLLEVGAVIQDTERGVDQTYTVVEVHNSGKNSQPKWRYGLVRNGGNDIKWLDAAGLSRLFGGNGRE